LPTQKTDKTAAEIAAEDKAASDAQREQMAKDTNKKRNDAMLEARNAIADRADEIKLEEEEMVPLTDEIWDQEDTAEGKPTRKTRAQKLADQEARKLEEDPEFAGLTEEEKERKGAAKLLKRAEREDRDADEARDAGADDSRKNDEGETEYRVGEEWLTVAQLPARAGDISDDDPLHKGKGGDTTQATRRASPTAEQREQLRREAEERRQSERAALRTKLIDLNTRASMGDEAAIAELTDMQLDRLVGDSPEIERMVDERVDARVGARTAFDNAVAWFESDDGYARELAAPGFKVKAGAIDARLAKEQPDLSPRQRLDLVGKELRKDLAQMAKFLGAKPNTGNGQRRDPPESKLDRKRNAPQVPQASGRPRPDVEPDEKETVSEAIQKLAQSRGQARPIQH
jgi:hypothetical protein